MLYGVFNINTYAIDGAMIIHTRIYRVYEVLVGKSSSSIGWVVLCSYMYYILYKVGRYMDIYQPT